VGHLIATFNMSPKDAWNCTLREYMMISTYKEGRAAAKEYSGDNQRDMLENFKMRELQLG